LSEILGGGLAVGTILLLEEDINSEYYVQMFKYFLAEGLAVDHALMLISSDSEDSNESILKKIPKNLTEASMLENESKKPDVQQSESKVGNRF
jgi:elongator complex protein 4